MKIEHDIYCLRALFPKDDVPCICAELSRITDFSSMVRELERDKNIIHLTSVV